MQALLKASAANHHGHVTFDYAQTTHPSYNALVPVMGNIAARPGLCTALCMTWLIGWRETNPRAFAESAESNLGQQSIIAYTNMICQVAANWRGATNNIMQQQQFVGAVDQALHPANVLNLSAAVAAHRYTILVGYGAGADSHAVAVLRAGQACSFFDPNEGELHFKTIADFAAWFFEALNGFQSLCFPNYNFIWRLQYD